MIYFGITLKNPFINSYLKNNKCFNKQLTKHKFLELEFIRDPSVIFNFEIRLSSHQDHAGFTFEIGLLSFEFLVNILDNRHWDYEHNNWENYDQDY